MSTVSIVDLLFSGLALLHLIKHHLSSEVSMAAPSPRDGITTGSPPHTTPIPGGTKPGYCRWGGADCRCLRLFEINEGDLPPRPLRPAPPPRPNKLHRIYNKKKPKENMSTLIHLLEQLELNQLTIELEALRAL